MKYLYWIFVLVTVVIRRIVFPLIYLVIPFRSKLRHIVYAYSLQNGIFVKRLYERHPKLNENKWLLDGTRHGIRRYSSVEYPEYGIISNEKVAKWKYWLALPLWLLLDDDANDDTYDKGFNRTIINGERKTWIPKFIVKRLAEASDKAEYAKVGNSFDLGDNMAEKPLYEFWSVLWWTLRNPSYNFNYKFNQINDGAKVFKIVILGRLFGWDEDGLLDGKMTYSWECGKKINK